jgi:hypothetical protein
MTLGNMRAVAKRKADYAQRFKLAGQTQRWAVTMAKVAIRQAVTRTPFPRWHFVSFGGREGNEARGVVDLIAISKDHGTPRKKLKRGDTFQIVLIQVKGGAAAHPTAEDGERLRAVARHHHAQGVLLASWRIGKSAQFFALRPKASIGKTDWVELSDVSAAFS